MGMRVRWLLVPLMLATSGAARAQEPATKPRLDIYGTIVLDMGYQSGQSDPDWFDVVRPTKLPAFENEFGADGRFFAGVRPTRVGFKGYIPTGLGELRTILEFDLLGTGVNAGQTALRMRHAWVELGQLGAGQTFSPFMDPDIFPGTIDFWGPNGAVSFRNVQLRWTPWQAEGSNLMVALERPGAAADQGVYQDRVELEGVTARFPLPDVSAHYRHVRDWGHVQLAGIVRWIEWDDLNDDLFDLSGEETGWGVNASSNVKLGDHLVRASVVYGAGIQNYMNDAPVDIGIETDFGDPLTPVQGKALPMLAVVAFLDLSWSSRWTSAVGYSVVDIDNADAQADDAFRRGHYAVANLVYHPVPGLLLGPELQWAKRENFRDGFTSDDVRLQFSAKYSFGVFSVGGGH